MTGELAAIAAAFFWAFSSVIYARVGERIAPLPLNFGKGIVAIALILITLALRDRLVPEMAASAAGWLVLSGVIGIGIGDTAFFAALNRIGPRRSLLFDTLTPPLTALLAFLFLQEKLSGTAWIGILLTLLGVAWVISERTTVVSGDRARAFWGVGFGSIAVFAQASGVVISRAVLADTEIMPLWSALVRLLAGTLVLPLAWGMTRESVQWKPMLSLKALGAIALASCFGTYLGIWLQQTALKFAPAGIAQTLIATSTLFVLPFSASLGERISIRAILGAIVSLCGVALLFGLGPKL